MKKIIIRAALVTAILLLCLFGIVETLWHVIRYVFTGKKLPEEPYFFAKTFDLIDKL